MSGKRKDKVTVVAKTQLVELQRLLNLKRFINMRLAQGGILNAEAAARAGVTQQRWSQLKSSDRLSPNDLAVVARGLGMSIDQLVEAVGER